MLFKAWYGWSPLIFERDFMKKRLYFYSAFIGLILLAFFLGKVFSGRLILPQSFHIGFITIRYYGIIIASAAAAGFYLAIKRAKLYGFERELAEDMLFWVIIGGFIGARLYHVFSSIGYYWQHPVNIFEVWNGGLSIYGALIGGVLTLWALQRIFVPKLGFLSMLDWLAPSLLLGQIIGRFGNLFNYEAFGYPTNLPWKMFVPLDFRPPNYLWFNFFHPFFLYEALGNAVILYLLIRCLKFKSPGALFFSYVLLYNTLRFGLEFLRIDSTFIDGIRLNAAMSLLLIIIGIVGILLSRKYAETP
jgi:phosphatidylglycerol---prolipoprotein diacylglyceryl transferase